MFQRNGSPVGICGYVDPAELMSGVRPIYTNPPDTWQYYIVTEVDGTHRPLAAVTQEVHSRNPGGRQAVLTSWMLMTILSDPANRYNLEAERAMSIDLYQNPHNEPMPTFESDTSNDEMHAFPFTVTCLWLAVCSNLGPPSHTARILDHVYIKGLDQAKGMIIFDISDLDHLRYGIMSFGDNVNDLLSHPAHVIEINQQNPLLSGTDFLTKYRFNYCIENAKELERLSIIDKALVDLTWPQGATSTRGVTKSLRDQAIVTLIDSTGTIDDFDISIFDGPRRIPDFKNLLQRWLQKCSAQLGSSRSTGQLISLAYERETHLDLVRLRGISAEAIGFALQTEELSNVKSISLCTDAIEGTTIDILDALSHSPSLRDLHFFQGPRRSVDEDSINFFKVLSRRPHVLKHGNVTLTGAFSSALNRGLWLIHELPAICHPPPDIFPVHYMLVRSPPGYGQRKHFPTYYYMGHALLKPEAFAAGFLRWLRNEKYAFSIGSSSLGVPNSGEVRPVVTWAKSEEFVPGSWVVLVSKDKHPGQPWRLREGAKVECVRYAFVRLLVDVEKTRQSRQRRYKVKPEHLQVSGLKEFLKTTAPMVDPATVDRSLTETAESIQKGLVWLDPGPERKRFSTLEHDEACELMNWFLNSPPAERHQGYRWDWEGPRALPGIYM
ncbi:uncharacterized protein F4822DRAFT_237909 [Hypoxylon trugodes]|uniref:uncharacterized protein n=1 Tax=Hypoxylon trugodes TaxID=326681 RepID=UPI00219D2496|nr:uncharacterized protein F4822DRAFT_237909 [Hypoxylon trugodes]KAI1388192.1 hypothetical protein F4822DRAFT_237909 [Hypoxylon trugodes]